MASAESARGPRAQGTQRFRNTQAQAALGIFGGGVFLIGLSTLAQPASRIAGAVFALIGLIVCIRALWSSDVLVGPSALRTRSILRTRRYRFTDLRSVEVRVGRTGFGASRREYLLLNRSDGKTDAFTALNSRPAEGDQPDSAVRRALACINERLAAA